MKTYVLLLLICPFLMLLSFNNKGQPLEENASSQTSISAQDESAREVPLILKEQKSLEFYIEQAEAWWKILEVNKKNENAWFNYYKANRWAQMQYGRTNSPQLDWRVNTEWLTQSKYLMSGDDIVLHVEQELPKSFMSYYLRVWNTKNIGKEKIPLLEKAHAINPNFYEIYDDFVMHYEIDNKREKRKEFNVRWFKSNDFSETFLNFYYNVLLTLKENAILLTYGDNPLLASWMLQDALHFRQDVTLVNIALMVNEVAYRNSIFKQLGIPPLNKVYETGNSLSNLQEIVAHVVDNMPDNLPIYFGLELDQQIKDTHEDKLYLVGLALEYSESNIDNLAALKRNFEHKYLLDYLTVQFTDDSYPIASVTNWSYLQGISHLYEHYKVTGDLNNAKRMKELALTIAHSVEGESYQQYRQNVINYFQNN